MKKMSPERKRWHIRYMVFLKRKQKKDKERRKKFIIEKKRLKDLNTRRNRFHKEVAPDDFSLISNPNGVISYFKKYEQPIKDGYGINFDISNVKTLTFEAVVLLLIKIKDTTYNKGVLVKGNGPSDKELAKLFNSSGFLDHVYSSRKSEQGGVMFKNSSSVIVDNENAGHLSEEIIKLCFKGINPNIGIYETLIECMANTHDHAGLGHSWWLTYYVDTGSIKVCFIDLGDGILTTIKTSIINKPWLKVVSELLTDSTYTKDVLKYMFERKTKYLTSRTKTENPERGRGLPQIYSFSQNKFVSSFMMISNNVFADLKQNSYSDLDIGFSGTLYYWEIQRS